MIIRQDEVLPFEILSVVRADSLDEFFDLQKSDRSVSDRSGHQSKGPDKSSDDAYINERGVTDCISQNA